MQRTRVLFAFLLAFVFSAQVFAQDNVLTSANGVKFTVPEGVELRGTSFVVTKTADTDDGTCDDDCSLREATAAADFDYYSNVIIPAGVYTLDTANLGRITTLGGFVSFYGAGAESTIIQGAETRGAAETGLFDFYANDTHLLMKDVTLRHGYATPTEGLAGGAIHVSATGGSLALYNVVVTENDSHDHGGGIYISAFNMPFQLLIRDSVFTNNTIEENANSGWGGAVYFFSEYYATSTVIQNSVFSGNTAGDYGGAVYVEAGDYNGSLTVLNSTFSNNTARAYDGGGLYYYSSQYASLYFDGATFYNNVAGTSGGGLFVNNNAYGSLTIHNSTFESNTASTEHGGGFYDDNSYLVDLRNTDFLDNSAGDSGGGFYLYTGYTAYIKDVNIIGNSAAYHGGGAYIDMEPLYMEDVNVWNNSADADNDGTGDGGGIYFEYYAPQLSRVSMAYNGFPVDSTGNLGPDCYYDGSDDVPAVSFGGNVITDPADCGVEWSVTGAESDDIVGNILGNYDFEFTTESGSLADWSVKNSTGDKRKCNKDKNGDGIVDKVIASSNDCAFQFKGNTGENTKVQQSFNYAPGTVQDGSTISGSILARANGVANSKLIVKVKYQDGTGDKGSANFAVTGSYGKYSAAVTVNGDVAQIKYMVKNSATSGKLFVDKAALNITAPELPAPVVQSAEPIALPDAPDGFRR